MTDKLTRYYFSAHHDFRTNGSMSAIRYATREEAEAEAIKVRLPMVAEQTLVIVREVQEIVAKVRIQSTVEIIPEIDQ